MLTCNTQNKDALIKYNLASKSAKQGQRPAEIHPRQQALNGKADVINKLNLLSNSFTGMVTNFEHKNFVLFTYQFNLIINLMNMA